MHHKKWLWIGAVAALCAPTVVGAQTVDTIASRALLLPGSVNVSVGTLAPAEPDNVQGSITTEQGFVPFRRGGVFIAGFMNITARYDTAGLPWNRSVPATAGVKIVAVMPGGVLQGVVGLNALANNGSTVSLGKAAYATYWSGWRADAAATTFGWPDALPGHAYASTGFITAAEPENWISSISVQQGVTIVRTWGVSTVPFIGVGATTDTQGFVWNNRASVDAGVKVTRDLLSGVVEAGFAQRREWDYRTGAGRLAPVVFVNYWLGWSPAAGRAN